jgi:hypothetical protein
MVQGSTRLSRAEIASPAPLYMEIASWYGARPTGQLLLLISKGPLPAPAEEISVLHP